MKLTNKMTTAVVTNVFALAGVSFAGNIATSVPLVSPPATASAAAGITDSAPKWVWLEAEGFKNAGGWIIEQQSFGHVGSAYLMAHGMGVPVADAMTRCAIPSAGVWTVWARTRDWIAPWSKQGAPGKFQVLVNGQALPETLGTNGKSWAWQKAGTVDIPVGNAEVVLHDLTGFNGRCDALYFSKDPGDAPPDDSAALKKWRRQKSGITIKNDPAQYDLIVVGGGVAGVCAAISASRLGLETLLLQDRKVLGGCNSSEVRVGLGGHIHVGKYPALGNVVAEIQPIYGSHNTHPAEFYEDKRKELAFRAPATGQRSHAKLLLGEHVYALEMDNQSPKRIKAVISCNTQNGTETRFEARLFVDATGDAILSRLAGCETMYGREARSRFNEINAPVEGDRQVMGHSVQWYSKQDDDGKACPFPDISDWALPFTEETVYYIRGGDWEQEAGQYRNMADDTEAIRDYGLLSIFSNWNYVKNHSKRKAEFMTDSFDWISPIGGKRESFRTVGDLILTQNDLEKNIEYPDGTAAITWGIDIHMPDPANVKAFPEPFRSCAYHRGAGLGKNYPVPYRCLYARDCANLFLAGRVISCSHVSFSAVRVMRTLGMLGEVVGIAAKVCKERECLPRDVYATYLEDLKNLMTKGVPKPATYHAYGDGGGYREAYHFKDLGWWTIWPRQTNIPENVKAAIKALGMEHRVQHPEIGAYGRRRLVLADESRARVHYWDSANPAASYSVEVAKPVWDLKKVGDMQYRIVCEKGFMVVDLRERKIVDRFISDSADQASSVCDLPDGGFLVSVNPQDELKGKTIRVLQFTKDRKLSRCWNFDGNFNARSMNRLENGEILLSHELGFLRGRLPEGGEKELTGVVLQQFKQPDGRNLYEVIPASVTDGYWAGAGYGAQLVHFAEDGSVIRTLRAGQPQGKKNVFYAQPKEISNGHVYVCNWTGHGANDSTNGWQVIEFNAGGGVDWYLDDPDRFGSISGLDVIETPGMNNPDRGETK